MRGKLVILEKSHWMCSCPPPYTTATCVSQVHSGVSTLYYCQTSVSQVHSVVCEKQSINIYRYVNHNKEVSSRYYSDNFFKASPKYYLVISICQCSVPCTTNFFFFFFSPFLVLRKLHACQVSAWLVKYWLPTNKT